MALKRDKMGVLSIAGGKWDYVLYTTASLVLVYGFASFAIDSGSLLDYATAIFFFVLAVHFARLGVRCFRSN